MNKTLRTFVIYLAVILSIANVITTFGANSSLSNEIEIALLWLVVTLQAVQLHYVEETQKDLVESFNEVVDYLNKKLENTENEDEI